MSPLRGFCWKWLSRLVTDKKLVLVLFMTILLGTFYLSHLSNKLHQAYHGHASNQLHLAVTRLRPGHGFIQDFSSPTSRNWTSDSEFLRRRRQVEDVCAWSASHTASVHGVFTHTETGVIYCFVPKAGCTFWKRIFSFVNKKVSHGSYKNPFEIPRLVVHNLQTTNGHRYDKVLHRREVFPVRLIVTREPLSRMIASYLDKMYLPDFWRTYGKFFMKVSRGKRRSSQFLRRRFHNSSAFKNGDRFHNWTIFKNGHRFPWNGADTSSNFIRGHGSSSSTSLSSDFKTAEDDFMRKHFDQLAAMFNSSFDPNRSSTFDQINCGKYLSFSDFVAASLYYPESHWTPVYDMCDPCQFMPTHVSHMESFTEDARAVLSHMGLDHILDSFDRTTQVNEELKLIVDYHFSLVFESSAAEFYKSCLTAQELAQRLWNTFRWQGYIHPAQKYQVLELPDVITVKRDLMDQIWTARDTGLRDPDSMKKMKKDFAQKLISTLSKEILQNLMWKFRFDYKMFGYERQR